MGRRQKENDRRKHENLDCLGMNDDQRMYQIILLGGKDSAYVPVGHTMGKENI